MPNDTTECEDWQDAGEPWRKLLGIDGTAGDAQDVPHPYIWRKPGDPCEVCGLAATYRMHTGGIDPTAPAGDEEEFTISSEPVSPETARTVVAATGERGAVEQSARFEGKDTGTDLRERLIEKLQDIPTGTDGYGCRIPSRRHREAITDAVLAVVTPALARLRAKLTEETSVTATAVSDAERAEGQRQETYERLVVAEAKLAESQALREKLAATIHAFPDARDAANIGHARMQRDRAVAERDALKAAIADVRRLQEMTIAASCRVQAIDQATDTLAVLDRALSPESHEDAPTADSWLCPRCGSPRWVAASLTGPVEYGGRAIKQCIPCGHYSGDPADAPETTPDAPTEGETK